MYKQPIQPRAKESESRFLDVLDGLLKAKSFTKLTIDEIALHAHLTRGAFLQRFGTKKQALLVLYEQYCTAASSEMDSCVAALPKCEDLVDVCIHLSETIERLQIEHFASNRAMHEHFLEALEVHPSTKRIFVECVDLMRKVQRRFLSDASFSDKGAFAGAQLLVTINYNYVLKAMPALPSESAERHKLVGQIITLALQR